ncbi:MAG: DUF4331 family protein [Candidatus Limnocylindria bacterium]
MRTLTLRAVAAPLVAVLALAALVIGSAAIRVGAADHLDAPTVKSDHRIDINDVYVFEGANTLNTVLVMTTNVHAGILSGTTFRPGALYEFKIDNTGDAVEDVAYRIKFGDARGDGSQQIHVQRADGAANPGSGAGGKVVAKGSTGETLSVAGGGTAWAGLADDPFYFDLVGFSGFKADLLAEILGDGLSAAELLAAITTNICTSDPAPNFFEGFDATAIVLEVPDAALDGGNADGVIGVWGETAIVEGGVLTQVERMGLPTINTVFNHTDPAKEAYNRANPSSDAALVGGNISFLVSTITGLAEALGALPPGFDEAAYGAAIAGALTPDMLTYDTDTAASFTALNGRGLNDDVINVAYSAVSSGVLTDDCVDEDNMLDEAFPYVGIPNPPNP